MRAVLAVVGAAGALFVAQPAAAWGWRGHEIIGSIAQQRLAVLNPMAAAKVSALLGGHSLAVAATWPDCAKDVVQSEGGFVYRPTPQYTPKVCTDSFGTDAEVAHMIDYVQRNWSQCVYSHGGECHGTYHFADIAIQQGSYGAGDLGANDHDVVHAIGAAIAVLEGKPAPAPFSINSQTEALELLAHFVGDLHQPLHVGAVYLNDDGQEVDPDPPNSYDPHTFTTGGNNLLVSGKKLHATWDDIAARYGTEAAARLVKAAAGVPQTGGDYHDWPGGWASDTVVQAKAAFDGMSFGKARISAAGQRTWPVILQSSSAYGRSRSALQDKQIVKAGEHLAELLAAVCGQPNACQGD